MAPINESSAVGHRHTWGICWRHMGQQLR
jgi:hypothetical protein